MKQGLINRAVLYIGAFLVAVVGVALVIAGLQFSDIPLRREGEGFFTLCRAAVLLAGVIVFAYGLFVLLLPHRTRKDKKRFIIQKSEGGELRIAVKAVESLVQKCVDMHQEMQTSSMEVFNRRDGLYIDLAISLAGNISIPLAAASLQKQIRQYLLASSGIDVREVRVSVETAEHDIQESPYLVETQDQSEWTRDASVGPQKSSGRRRLFRRGATEPSELDEGKAMAPPEEPTESLDEDPPPDPAQTVDQTQD